MLAHQQPPFPFIYRDLRDNKNVRLSAAQAHLAEDRKNFVTGFVKWCIDRHEDEGEELRSLADMRFKREKAGTLLVTCVLGARVS